MGTSYLVMGELTDFITGQILPDTHDERLIQKISRFLVKDRGYSVNDILTRRKMSLTVDGKTGSIMIHFIIHIDHRPFAVIMYGPGSIVTRQRPTIAVARIFTDYMIPFCVITNGEEANLMDTKSGKVIGKNLGSIFSRKEASALLKDIHLETLTKERREKEQRILYTMDILTENECRDFTCQI
ncbi:MAG: type I restriction enzyme HsdR N-terminal domain-containing protein [Desulfobacteraceae bacterium]|nr:type I restriction enzyme HsdR N-terminal domain-containing protein [Desulfobacteraceae bacterium]MBC2755700.1 type I restriction enzyme HsdR N-terminal domain-containing protein [Desulfobacteraceae bacterium]